MTDAEKELLLASVKRDIEGWRAELARYEEQVLLSKQKLVRLTDIEGYLSSAAPTPVSPRTGGRSPREIPVSELLDVARKTLKESGPQSPRRPLDIARVILPGYDPKADDRVFENRIYSLMRKRPMEFVKVGKGMWTLVAFGVKPAGDEPDEDESHSDERENLESL